MARKEVETPPVEDAVDAVEAPADTPAPDAPPEGSTDVHSDPYADSTRAWVAAHIAGGPIARNTDCWNALQAALPHLGKFIITNQPQEG